MLGLDTRTVRRMCAEGRLKSFVTPGGHRRIALADIEAVREGTADPQRSADRSHPQPSAIIRQKRERLEELNLALQERRAKVALQEFDDEQRQRAEEEQAAERAHEGEARRMRLAAEGERERRQQERKEVLAKREWQDEKVRLALNSLPADAPQDIVLDVTEAVRKNLEDLYQSAGHAEDVADKIILAIVEKESRSWRRSQLAELAAQKAAEELTGFERNYWGPPTEWQLAAEEEALAAIAKLPEPAPFEQMVSAARAAGKRVSQKYELSEKCKWAMIRLSSLLPGLLPYSSSQEKVKAEEAVRTAFAGLPVGASSSEFDAARDEGLAPFIAAEAQARAEREAIQTKAQADREANEAKRKLEIEADLHSCRVNSYLGELEANPSGWDFEGKRYEYAEKIKHEIRPTLIEDLPLDLTAGRKRVEELVDEWLACHWEPPEDHGQ